MQTFRARHNIDHFRFNDPRYSEYIEHELKQLATRQIWELLDKGEWVAFKVTIITNVFESHVDLMLQVKPVEKTVYTPFFPEHVTPEVTEHDVKMFIKKKLKERWQWFTRWPSRVTRWLDNRYQQVEMDIKNFRS